MIQRKPGALRNGAPFLELPNAFKRLQQHLLKRPGGDREMAEILALVLQHDEQAVLCAVEMAVNDDAPTKTHVLNLLHRLVDGKASEVTKVEVYSLAQLFSPKCDARNRLRHKSVLIIDEAGLLTTRRMRELLDLVWDKNAKIIFVGDEGQLHPIGAGSGMRLIAGIAANYSLNKLVRMKDATHRSVSESLVALRAVSASGPTAATAGSKRELSFGPAGDAALATALGIADKMLHTGRWKLAINSHEACEAVADALEQSIVGREGFASCLALARTNREARQSSRLLRERLRHHGLISGDDLRIRAVTPMGMPVTLPLQWATGVDPCAPRADDGAGVADWRERMKSEAGKETYKDRSITECAHAHMRERDLWQFLVRGEEKVKAQLTIHALAHNIKQGENLRRRAKGSSHNGSPHSARLQLESGRRGTSTAEHGCG